MTNAQNSTNAAASANPATALWRIAVSEYERERAAYAEVSGEYDEELRLAEERCPSREDEFKLYGLAPYMLDTPENRARALETLDVFIERREHPELYNSDGTKKPRDENIPDLTDEECDRLAEEAQRIANDYFDFQAKRRASFQQFSVAVEKRHDEACDRRRDASDKLLNTPAPDADALMTKLDLLVEIMTEGDSEDAASVTSIRDDARRLLGGK